MIATPSISKESDFDRVFKPFHVKTDATLASIKSIGAKQASRAMENCVDSEEPLTARGELI